MRNLLGRRLPSILAIVIGLVVLAGQFGGDVARDLRLTDLSAALIDWAAILFAVVLVLGLLNLVAVHGRRLRAQVEGWPNSLALLLTVFLVLCAGLNGANSASLQWIFTNVQAPLQASLLSLVVFLTVSAVGRAIRMRRWGTLLMLTTAVVVLLGQLPFAESLSAELVDAQQWILLVPAVAGQRGRRRCECCLASKAIDSSSELWFTVQSVIPLTATIAAFATSAAQA
jgi:hypothetical protein